jgi:acyl-CoA dehydrogenase
MMHAMNLHHLCWPFFDSGHATLAHDFGRWAGRELAAFEAEEGGDGQAARRIFQLLAASHWLDATLPAARGGRESRLDVRKICLMREISAFSSAMADVALSEPWLGILPIALYGSPALRDELLPPYLAGRLLPAFALSEPDAGSDAAAIATTARRDGDDYILDGVKTWTSNCGLADLYVVFARMEGEGGLSAFAVDGRSNGIALDQRLPVLSPHTVGTWRLTNCRVPSHRLIGDPGEGFAIAMRVLELFRPTVGAATLGFARRAMAEAVKRSVSRVAFKKPIAEHQLIQAKLADMAVKIDAAALLTYRAAWQADSTGGNIAREAAMAKLFSSEMAFEVIDEALQIFGGLGVVRGTTVERLFRHSRAFRIFDGTSEIQRLIIARRILQQDPS